MFEEFFFFYSKAFMLGIEFLSDHLCYLISCHGECILLFSHVILTMVTIFLFWIECILARLLFFHRLALHYTWITKWKLSLHIMRGMFRSQIIRYMIPAQLWQTWGGESNMRSLMIPGGQGSELRLDLVVNFYICHNRFLVVTSFITDCAINMLIQFILDTSFLLINLIQ